MTKVTITVEQAKAIKEHRNMGRKGIINHILDLKYKTYDEDSVTTPGLSDLSEMDIPTLIDALYIGYEIEKPKFEVGDWVVGLSKTIYKLTKETGSYGDFEAKDIRGIVSWVSPENIRHATKEEIFWAELGREVGEFRDGDVVTFIDGQLRTVKRLFNGLGSAKEEYENGTLKGFYPTESFKRFPTGNES